MQNTTIKSAIPRDSIVVEYVSGTLSEHARIQFESKLADNIELQEAVEFERSLRASLTSLGNRNARPAADNFDDLLARIELDESLESTHHNTEPVTSNARHSKRRSANVYAFTASVAIAGIIATLLVNPFASQRQLAPVYTGLSTPSDSVDLRSMVSEARIAKLTLAESLQSNAISELLAGYQLELLSQIPEQNGLIVLAQRSIETKMLKGWRNDSRIIDAELVSLNAEKK